MKTLWILLATTLLVGCATGKTDLQKEEILPPPVVESPHTSQPPEEKPEYSQLEQLYFESLYESVEPGQGVGQIDTIITPGAVTRPFYMFAWWPKLVKPDWDNALLSEVAKYDWSGIESVCLKINTADCAAQLLSKMAKYESDYNTNAIYHETGDLAGVISRGLLQISQASANQKAYQCGIKDPKQLHDPLINLKCGVKILYYQAKKTGKLIDGTKNAGCGTYWAVCRKFKVDKKTGKLVEKTSFKGIMDYIGKF